MNATDKIRKSIQNKNSLLCVGLDPDPENLGGSKSQFEFNKKIIKETADFVCSFKPNIAFYEARGLGGLKDLKLTIEYLKKNYNDIPIILDAKRADIPNTSVMYAKAIYDGWGVDATTVYPHLGLDSLKPFFEYKDKLTILLVKTSNPDSEQFQNLKTAEGPYYLSMAKEIADWKFANFGIFVGATYPHELRELRAIFPDRIFLSAGIGAQKAENKKAVFAGIDKNKGGILFNASRSIIYAQDPQKAARNLRDEINSYR